MEVAQHPFCRTLLVRASHRPAQTQRVGKNSKAKLPRRVAQGGSLGTMNIIIHSRVERDIVNACVHTLSVSPLNSKAFKELKILFTFVLPIATLIVLSTRWVFNKFTWINQFSQMHIFINIGIRIYPEIMPEGIGNKE